MPLTTYKWQLKFKESNTIMTLFSEPIFTCFMLKKQSKDVILVQGAFIIGPMQIKEYWLQDTYRQCEKKYCVLRKVIGCSMIPQYMIIVRTWVRGSYLGNFQVTLHKGLKPRTPYNLATLIKPRYLQRKPMERFCCHQSVTRNAPKPTVLGVSEFLSPNKKSYNQTL